MPDRFRSREGGEGEALDQGKLYAIEVNCRRLLTAAWPDAGHRKLAAGTRVLRPYLVHLAITGDYDYDEVRSVGLRLREIFYSEADNPHDL